jgi:hypothetical protein
LTALLTALIECTADKISTLKALAWIEGHMEKTPVESDEVSNLSTLNQQSQQINQE